MEAGGILPLAKPGCRENCGFTAVVANDAFVFSVANISTTADEYKSRTRVLVLLNWTIGNKCCHMAKTDQTVLCKEHSDYTDSHGEVGYRCQCWTGYEGNPYIAPGCQGLHFEQWPSLVLIIS
ncbi:hypothetical protein Ancab_008428 [Ancistrocladus abbreviatus]